MSPTRLALLIVLASCSVATAAEHRTPRHGHPGESAVPGAGAYAPGSDPTRRSGAVYNSYGINRDSINNSSGVLGNSNVGGNGGPDSGGSNSH